MRRCIGRTLSGQRCKLKVVKGLCCTKHRHQISKLAAYLIFTALAGLASITSCVLDVYDRESRAASLEVRPESGVNPGGEPEATPRFVEDSPTPSHGQRPVRNQGAFHHGLLEEPVTTATQLARHEPVHQSVPLILGITEETEVRRFRQLYAANITVTARNHDLSGELVGGPFFAVHTGLGMTEWDALKQARARAFRSVAAQATTELRISPLVAMAPRY